MAVLSLLCLLFSVALCDRLESQILTDGDWNFILEKAAEALEIDPTQEVVAGTRCYADEWTSSWNANQYWAGCRDKANLLSIWKYEENDYVFGGFTSMAYQSISWQDDQKAFVYRVRPDRHVGTYKAANSVFMHSSYGPYYGGTLMMWGANWRCNDSWGNFNKPEGVGSNLCSAGSSNISNKPMRFEVIQLEVKNKFDQLCHSLGFSQECYDSDGCELDVYDGICIPAEENVCWHLEVIQCLQSPKCLFQWDTQTCAMLNTPSPTGGCELIQDGRTCVDHGCMIDPSTHRCVVPSGDCGELRIDECQAADSGCVWNYESMHCAEAAAWTDFHTHCTGISEQFACDADPQCYFSSDDEACFENTCGFHTELLLKKNKLDSYTKSRVSGPCECQTLCLVGNLQWLYNSETSRCICFEGRVKTKQIVASNIYMSSYELVGDDER